MLSLQDEIESFKQWAPAPENRSGEWECEYDHWDRFWAAAVSTIEQYANTKMPLNVVDDVLYALARDNECEHLREHLVGTPQLLSALAVHATGTADADAKWQIVVSVAEAEIDNAAELIRPYLADENEYVRRRSLMAYAAFAPGEAEEIALQNLTDTFEYTRIAALHVLHIIESSHLAANLDALEDDSNTSPRLLTDWASPVLPGVPSRVPDAPLDWMRAPTDFCCSYHG